MSKDEEQNYIFTDSEMSHRNIWDAYNGFCHHQEGYIMFPNTESMRGMIRFGYDFYEKTQGFYSAFKQLKKPEKEKFVYYWEKKQQQEFTWNDWKFIRRFMETFMLVSGLNRIIYSKSLQPKIIKAMTK
jgi:hypothetical protein